ncbi:hypothetical protein [Parachlamydia sp. AcF125]|uniref:hypothetical protein n=1 Tax=Parachlamydia sp. AcF125 TaxID=2795736 RepID=UPI001BCA603F|nr:hypothetical protein [Parachlamydia sp. AcF125]MBS4167846.1 hypothetical protein [Parachlamydia sp. AcF125]
MFIDAIIVVSVVIFAVLAYFTIRTLITVRKVLTKLGFFMDSMEMRMEKIDPLLRSLANMGEICEEKTYRLQKEWMEKEEAIDLQEEPSGDLAAWLLLSLTLVRKFLKRR